MITTKRDPWWYFFLGALFYKRATLLHTFFQPCTTPSPPGVGRERPQKQGCHETVVEAKIAPTLNAHRSRRDPPRNLRFAAYSRDTVDSNRAKFSQPAFDSF